MQNKKVTMLAAVLAVTVIAMAGVGYAITYSATTTNTSNTMNSTYMKLSQDGNAEYSSSSFLSDLYISTVNTGLDAQDKPTYTYTVETDGWLVGGKQLVDEATEGAIAVAKISNELTLTLEQTGTVQQNVKMTVTADLFTPTDGLTYYLLFKNTSDNSWYGAPNVGKTWTISQLPAGETSEYEVSLVVSGVPATPASGFPVNGATEKCSFVFVASKQV